ncbi:hypothetical protein ACOSP7_017141 [Xanthoceras sorbifolium]
MRERLAKLEANEDSEEVDRVETWIAGHKHKDGMPVNENVGETIKQMKAISLDKTTIIREDAVSQVLGNEHRGCVRGLGFGVTPTRVQVAVIGKQTTTQLQEEMKTLRQQSSYDSWSGSLENRCKEDIGEKSTFVSPN